MQIECYLNKILTIRKERYDKKGDGGEELAKDHVYGCSVVIHAELHGCICQRAVPMLMF